MIRRLRFARNRGAPGRERAKANGKSLGRKQRLSPHETQEAIRRRDEGESVCEIARSYNVSTDTISRLTTV
jgi:DNA invertase Pin-like site-specific DNA recombinase